MGAQEASKREQILGAAATAGFDLAGITSLEIPERDLEEFAAFLAEGRHGSMAWMERHLPFKKDPALLMPGSVSALVLGTFYRTREADEALEKARVRISRYAMAPDYHSVLRKRGKVLIAALRKILPDAKMRFCVDSAPAPERALGRLAGLGFQGKNTNLIHPGRGSYFFISVLLLSVELEAGIPERDRCGSCRICIDACPTSALSEYRLDANKCISYLTIEHKGDTSAADRSGWSFGCDVCQEVCPYNRADSYGTNWFPPRTQIRDLMQTGLLEKWDDLAHESPIARVSEEKFRNNLEVN